MPVLRTCSISYIGYISTIFEWIVHISGKNSMELNTKDSVDRVRILITCMFIYPASTIQCLTNLIRYIVKYLTKY